MDLRDPTATAQQGHGGNTQHAADAEAGVAHSRIGDRLKSLHQRTQLRILKWQHPLSIRTGSGCKGKGMIYCPAVAIELKKVREAVRCPSHGYRKRRKLAD